MTRCPLNYRDGMVFGLQALARTGMYSMYSDQGVTNHGVHLTDYDVVAPRYPRGLSPHGLRYLLFPPENGNAAIERELEQCRLDNHPMQPSRYESYFAWPTEKAARQWMAEESRNGHSCTLLRVEADRAIPRQQELVNHFPLLRKQGEAPCHMYWQQTAQQGRIELQMPGAITVTEVIQRRTI